MKITRKKLRGPIILLLLVIFTIPSFYSLLRPGFYSMQDDIQAFRIHQMDKCFQDGQIPCRWVPDMGYQYGYPQFNYYSPFIYYLGEIIHLAGFQFVDVVKILIVLGFIASAFTSFIFLRSFFGEWTAFIATMLYIYTPFKAVEVYVRGSLSEFWAFVFFPLLFWSSYKLILTKNLWYGIVLSVSTGLLLLTHNLMSLLFLPILGVWFLAWISLEKSRISLAHIFLSLLLGFGIAAFFVLPMIFEKQFVHTETLLSGYFDYRQHFVSIKQLLLSNYWDYGSSEFGLKDTVNLSTGPLHWIIGFLGVLLALFNFKKHKKLSTVILILGALELSVLFMVHEKSSFIWSNIQALSYLQFPWRLLSFSVFLLSFLSAAAISQIKRRGGGLHIILGGFVVLGVFALHLQFFQPKDWFALNDAQKFSGQSWEKQLTISIFDYLPIYAKLPPNHKAPDEPEVLEGQATIERYTKRSYFQQGEVQADTDTTLRLPILDFPGMIVLDNGKIISHRNDDCRNQEYCFGLISFNLPQGYHRIKVQLTDTPIRQYSNIISLISILVVLGTAVYISRDKKLWYFDVIGLSKNLKHKYNRFRKE